MSRQTIITSHVYEVTFRILSQEPLDTSKIVSDVKTLLASNFCDTHPSARELCFNEENGDVCLMTEGHRGRHEGSTGNRWGYDL